MLTRRALNQYVLNFLPELSGVGIQPERAVLFGSYVSGKPNDQSDIDVAVWHQSFTGCITFDCVALLPVLKKYPMIELHTFESGEDATSNPFIGEIERKGVELRLPQAMD